MRMRIQIGVTSYGYDGEHDESYDALLYMEDDNLMLDLGEKRGVLGIDKVDFMRALSVVALNCLDMV